MSTCWDAPLAELRAAAHGWAGAWTIADTLGRALERLATIEGSDDDLTLTYAGMEVALALSELQWADPTGTPAAIDVDLGASLPSRADALHRLCYLVDDVVVLAIEAHDAGAPAREVSSGQRAFVHLFQAQEAMAGRRP